jgi:hypothetical protein
MSKKIACIITSLLIVFTSQTPVFAASKSIESNSFKPTTINSSGTINPNFGDLKLRRYCGNSPEGLHHMYTKGMGTILNQDDIVLVGSGNAYQCKYCNTVVISEYNAVNYKLGNYAVWYAPYRLSINGTFLTINDDDLCYKSDNRLTGFEFNYS